MRTVRLSIPIRLAFEIAKAMVKKVKIHDELPNMKTICFVVAIICSLIFQSSFAQVNYVRTWTVMKASTDVNAIPSFSVTDAPQVTQYFDGLGRPVQTVAKRGSLESSSGNNYDLVSMTGYDAVGRQNASYLPYVASTATGAYKTDAATAQPAFYNSSTSPIAGQGETGANAHSLINFELSPLNRPQLSMAAGNSWVGSTRGIQSGYFSNTTTDDVKMWTVTNATPPSVWGTFAMSGIYAAGSLYKNITTDEDGHQVVEFKDKEGKIVLKKVGLSSSDNGSGSGYAGWACTYYIYDVLNNLRCVVQPEGVNTLVGNGWGIASILTSQCFRYEYDQRNRMAIKQVPGSQPVYMVYDVRDRLVMTQDGNQQVNKQWTIMKYDALDRPVITGIYNDNSAPALNQQGMQTAVNSYYSNLATNGGAWYETYSATGSVHGYSNVSFPAASFQVLTVTYYDNYNFINDLPTIWGTTPVNYAYLNTEIPIDNVNNISAQETVSNASVKGRATGTRTNILGTTDYLNSVNYYDNKYRVIQNLAQNNKGGIDRITNVVDFPGRVLKSKTTHTTSKPSTQIVAYRFSYDAVGRKRKTYLNLNNEPNDQLVSLNNYNSLGQLAEKNLHLLYDSQDGQSGTITSDNIVATTYTGESNLIARNSVILGPNYVVTASSAPYRAAITGATAAQAESTGTYFQSVDYRYNIRGWLTSMNNSQLTNDGVMNNDTNDLFGMQLGYNSSIGTSNISMYNGNISAIKWSGNLAPNTTKKDVAYNFSYDAMNRLTADNYKTNSGLGVWSPSSAFGESISQYDLNGNIMNLTRTGSGGSAMDNLTYTYQGTNQLRSVTDPNGATAGGFVDGTNTGDDYGYDANGNMQYDLNKSIGTSIGDPTHLISYNHLNLPTSVVKNTNEKIVYTYDAGGRKLMQQVYNASNQVIKTTDYVGAFIYQDDVLQFINHEEGRIIMTNPATPEYQYHLKDHLGNVRLTFTTKGQSAINYTTDFEAPTNPTFQNYTRTGFDLVDHTDAGTAYTYVQWLNGGTNGRVGLAKSMPVLAGDKVTISAYAKYMNLGTNPNPTGLINSLAAAFGVSSASTGIDGKIYNGLNTYSGVVPNGNHDFDNLLDDESEPKCFVNIIFFDKDYNYVDAAWKQVTSYGAQTSATVKQPPHDFITLTATAPAGGYAFVFLSNEHYYYVDMYYDDVTVSLTPGPVVQMEDYYPFGLTFNSFTRENSLPQNYLFNDKELQKDLSLNWEDHGARMYMPEIGKWGAADPKSDKFDMWSPYSFSANNPVLMNDPNGEDWTLKISQKDGKTIYTFTLTGAVYNESGQKYDMNALVAQMKKQIEAVFNFSKDKITVNTTVNLRAVETLKEVKSTDHLFTIMSNSAFDKHYNSDLNGVSDLGGLKVMLPARTADAIMTDENLRTLPHEVAHTAGLYHPDKHWASNLQHVNSSDQLDHHNLMYPHGLSAKINGTENVNAFTHLKVGQIQAIAALYSDGLLNQRTQFENKWNFSSVGTIPIVTKMMTGQLNYSNDEYVRSVDRVIGPKY